MKDKKYLCDMLNNKKVLFIATKNEDYIRIIQEIDLVKRCARECTVVAYPDKKYIKRVLKVISKLVFMSVKEYDVVIVGFMAQMVFLMFPWKFRKNTVVTDFFVSVYDTLVYDRKKFSERSIFAKFFKWIDKGTIRKSDYVIVDTRTHGKYFINELEAKEDNMIVYYLQANTAIYHPMEINKPEKYREKFVVLYFGSILPLQGVDIVMKAMEELKNEHDLQFVIIGPIGEKVKKVESDMITYINWLTQEKLAEYIAFSDICLAGHFSDEIEKANRTIPGKAYIYKAMDKRFILGDSEANRELFKENEKQYYVKLGQPTELAKIIKQIKDKVNG